MQLGASVLQRAGHLLAEQILSEQILPGHILPGHILSQHLPKQLKHHVACSYFGFSGLWQFMQETLGTLCDSRFPGENGLKGAAASDGPRGKEVLTAPWMARESQAIPGQRRAARTLERKVTVCGVLEQKRDIK